MYKLFMVALSTLTFLNFNTKVEDQNPTKSQIKTVQTDILVGKIDREQLQEEDYGKWFNPRYEAYEVNKEAVDELSKLLKDVNITIFMGTWCGDSKRETPNVYKIFDAAAVSEDQVELIAVSYDKTTPDELEKGLDIQRVPTIIFKKNDKELGRIVEYPIESLENDMLKILKGEDYKHAYAK